MPFSVFPGHGLSADYPRIPGRKKKISATLGTFFMEKSRNELLISRGNDFFLQVCKELIVSIYVPRKTGKNQCGIFHVK